MTRNCRIDRNFFLYDSISFLTQLHEGSCQSLFFLWFCLSIWKLALSVTEEWGNNIPPCQCIKEWESSTFSLAKFFNNLVDVVEPIWDCTAQKGKDYTVKTFHKSPTCNQWYYNIHISSSYNELFQSTSHTLDHLPKQLLISFLHSINAYWFI